jgi:hypothetical protein
MNFYCMGTGNGVLATVSAAANSTTQTFDNNNNVRYLRNGMRLSFWNAARTVLRGSATVTSFPTSGNTTVTLDSAVNVAAATDVATIFGGNNQAITGLKAIIDDTSEANVIFQNQSRNTYRNLRAQAIDASSASLDLELLTRMIGANIQIRMGARVCRGWKKPTWTKIGCISSTGRRFRSTLRKIGDGRSLMETSCVWSRLQLVGLRIRHKLKGTGASIVTSDHRIHGGSVNSTVSPCQPDTRRCSYGF